MKKNFLPLLMLGFICWLLYWNNVTNPQAYRSAHTESSQDAAMRWNYISSDLEEDIVMCIAHVEGFVSKPYYCGGWAVGYGSSYYADGTPVTQFSHSVTKKEARACLIAHLRKHVYPSIRRSVKRPLDDGQYIACCMLIYNIGEGAFETSSFLRTLNANASLDLCAQEMAKYNKVKGQTWTALQKRRWLEGAMLCGYITPDNVRRFRSNAIYHPSLALLYRGSHLNYSEDAIERFLQNSCL